MSVCFSGECFSGKCFFAVFSCMLFFCMIFYWMLCWSWTFSAGYFFAEWFSDACFLWNAFWLYAFLIQYFLIKDPGYYFFVVFQMWVLLEIIKFHLHKSVPGLGIIRNRGGRALYEELRFMFFCCMLSVEWFSADFFFVAQSNLFCPYLGLKMSKLRKQLAKLCPSYHLWPKSMSEIQPFVNKPA